jgi:DNA-binding NtrC family response regulator
VKTSAGESFSADFGAGLATEAASRTRAEPETDCVLRLIGQSPAIQRVRELIGRVAPTDSTVLICGESGCGKELVAESIHAMSPRAGQPFVAINCAAIPATLIEAELFGHERGSFTGALRTREGVFERAHGGTLLLDEITEMPLDLQSRLLRVLETKRLNRVGGSDDLEVDVRVIADLLLGELNLRHGTNKRLSEELRSRFLRHDWPGNVRELRNAVERAFILCDGELRLDEAEMPTLRASTDGDTSAGQGVSIPIGATLEEIERTFILATLKHFEGDKRRTADVLGCSLKTLYNKLHAYQRERHAGMN